MILLNEIIVLEKIKDLEKLKKSIPISNNKVNDYLEIENILKNINYELERMLDLILEINKRQDIMYFVHCIKYDFLSYLNNILSSINKLIMYKWNEEQEKIITYINIFVNDYVDILKELLELPLHQKDKIKGSSIVFGNTNIEVV